MACDCVWVSFVCVPVVGGCWWKVWGVEVGKYVQLMAWCSVVQQARVVYEPGLR